MTTTPMSDGSSTVARAQPPSERRRQRRDELLDVAATLVRDTGTGTSVTIDGVARAAGRSRPIVYKFFANAEELIAALYQREQAELDARVAAAMAAADDFPGKARALLDAYLDALGDGSLHVGEILERTTAGPAIDGLVAARQQVVLLGLTGMIAEYSGLDHPRALTAAVLVMNGVGGALDLWRAAPAARDDIVADYLAFVLAGIQGLVDTPRP